MRMRPGLESVLDRKQMGFTVLGSAAAMDRTHQVRCMKWLLARKTFQPNGFSAFGATDLGWLSMNPEADLECVQLLLDAGYRLNLREKPPNLRHFQAIALTKGIGCMVKVAPWQRPSSAPAAPQGAPGSSDWLGTPRKRPAHRVPS